MSFILNNISQDIRGIGNFKNECSWVLYQKRFGMLMEGDAEKDLFPIS